MCTDGTVVNPSCKFVGRKGRCHCSIQQKLLPEKGCWDEACRPSQPSGCLLQVTIPGPASQEVQIYLQGATKVIPIPVPRQTPAPPQPFPEPQPGPPPGFQGPECEIQVTTLTPSVAATRSEPLLLCSQGLLGSVVGACWPYLVGTGLGLLFRSLKGHLCS